MKFIEGGADLQFTSNTFIFLFNTNFVALLLVEDIDSNFLVQYHLLVRSQFVEVARHKMTMDV